MGIKTGLLAIVISASSMVSGPVLAQDEAGNADHINVIATEICAKMAGGKPLEKAVEAVSEKYARELRQFPDILVSVYSAIAIAAKKCGNGVHSAEFITAIVATLEMMIYVLEIAEKTVVNAAVMANIDITVITGRFTPRPRLASIISNKASSGGSAGSPAI